MQENFNNKDGKEKTDLIGKSFGKRTFVVTDSKNSTVEQERKTDENTNSVEKTTAYVAQKKNKVHITEYGPDGKFLRSVTGSFEPAPCYDDFDKYISSLEAEEYKGKKVLLHFYTTDLKLPLEFETNYIGKDDEGNFSISPVQEKESYLCIKWSDYGWYITAFCKDTEVYLNGQNVQPELPRQIHIGDLVNIPGIMEFAFQYTARDCSQPQNGFKEIQTQQHNNRRESKDEALKKGLAVNGAESGFNKDTSPKGFSLLAVFEKIKRDGKNALGKKHILILGAAAAAILLIVLCSLGNRWDRQYEKARRLWENRNYAAAAEIFESLGPQARTDWASSIYMLALDYGVAMDFEKEAEHLLLILNEPSHGGLAAEILEELADYFDVMGQTAMAERIWRELGADDGKPAAANEKADYNTLLTKVDRYNVHEIVGELDAAGGAQAACYVEILELLQRDEYYLAAQKALDAAGKYSDSFSQSDWHSLISNYMEYDYLSEGIGLEEWMHKEAAESILNNYHTNVLDETHPAEISTSSTFGELSREYVGSISDNYRNILVPSLDSIKARCGKEPQGKVLVLHQQYDYPERKLYCAVDKELTRILPADMIPANLDQVQYLLVYTFDNDFQYVGTFERSVKYASGATTVEEYDADVIRLKATVQLIDLKSDALKYSATVYGETEPELHYISANEWYCGEAPDVSENIMDALKTIA